MKNCIITMYGNFNCGNRLQNYALTKVLEEYGDVVTVKEIAGKKNASFVSKNLLKMVISKVQKNKRQREKNFKDFTNTYMKNTPLIYTGDDLSCLNIYDNYIIGSDQIWNHNFRGECFGDFEFALFADSDKCISYAASIGIGDIPNEKKDIYIRGLKHLKSISVREDRAKEIVYELTGRKDIEVLVDPTMLLTANEWDKVSKKPAQLTFDKYIFCYFLGNVSSERKKQIDLFAKEHGCQIINFLDKHDPFYTCGPSEFLYLEKNAYLICTDSFHSSIFGILYDRPFIVFDRDENLISMNSRIDTLLNKFQLKNRRFEGSITTANMNHDYSEAFKLLEIERNKSREYFKGLLDLSNEENEV